MRATRRRVGWGAALIVGAALCVGASSVAAQRPTSVGIKPESGVLDSAQLGNRAKRISDSLKRPPISPRRAFLTSLVLPGYAQSKLDRPTASMLFAAFEILSIGMLRKSAQDLNDAKRAPKDSIFVGVGVVDPATGQTYTSGYKPSPFNNDRLQARKTHYEDWVALIIFNHLLSSADAYVAANLWDFKANVSVDADNKAAKIGASKSF